jgi:IS5 family transposase
MSKEASSKRPEVEGVAELSMRLSQQHLAEYGATTSRHDFTQRQLMSCLILRAYLKTTYRGVLDLLAASASLRACLGLEDKLPHYTTLQKFSARSQVVKIAQKLVATIGQRAAAQTIGPKDAAMDGTGLAHTAASEYFRHRSGGKIRGWVKVSVMVLCGSLLPLALVVDAKPGNDCTHAQALITQAQAVARPDRLYADAGYDSEPLHQRCREQWGVESVIQPVQRRADGQRTGKWRALMSPEYLQKAQYQRRWSVESFFSGLKRTMGSTLSARQPQQKLAEAALRVLAYAIRR